MCNNDRRAVRHLPSSWSMLGYKQDRVLRTYVKDINRKPKRRACTRKNQLEFSSMERRFGTLECQLSQQYVLGLEHTIEEGRLDSQSTQIGVGIRCNEVSSVCRRPWHPYNAVCHAGRRKNLRTSGSAQGRNVARPAQEDRVGTSFLDLQCHSSWPWSL